MRFEFPYPIAEEYKKPVAYFCMEYAIHQSLKQYAGGLGFLAGSYMRSAYELHQNVVGIGILWKNGYYDQVRKSDQSMDILFQEKIYGFLIKTDIKFNIKVSGHNVLVAAWYLPPAIFKTAPIFFLSTDIEENDFLARSICQRLYDSNPEARIAASILLGIGGGRLLQELGWHPEIYHLNESHGLPLAFHLFNKLKSVDAVKKHLVFTNHTPELGGNPEEDFQLLDRMGFFDETPFEIIKRITGITGEKLNYTLAALRLASIANAVSKMHCTTLQSQWNKVGNLCPIVSVTNGQNFSYWADEEMYRAFNSFDNAALKKRKEQCKLTLFEEVADQCGEIYDPATLTIVFAKRFAGYKRPELLFRNRDRFHKLVTNKERPIQVIWAGKPHPMDYNGIGVFDQVVNLCKTYKNCAILVGYELKLSKLLKMGADLWLNLPRITHEASGTSGMSAAMNGAINLSIPDGWFPEFAKDGINSFVVPSVDASLPDYQQDDEDAARLYDLLEQTIIPMYYDHPEKWQRIINNSMADIIPAFDSNRMNRAYYKDMYTAEPRIVIELSK